MSLLQLHIHKNGRKEKIKQNNFYLCWGAVIIIDVYSPPKFTQMTSNRISKCNNVKVVSPPLNRFFSSTQLRYLLGQTTWAWDTPKGSVIQEELNRLKPLSAQKKQNLVMDSSEIYFTMRHPWLWSLREAQCSNIKPLWRVSVAGTATYITDGYAVYQASLSKRSIVVKLTWLWRKAKRACDVICTVASQDIY